MEEGKVKPTYHIVADNTMGDSDALGWCFLLFQIHPRL